MSSRRNSSTTDCFNTAIGHDRDIVASVSHLKGVISTLNWSTDSRAVPEIDWADKQRGATIRQCG